MCCRHTLRGLAMKRAARWTSWPVGLIHIQGLDPKMSRLGRIDSIVQRLTRAKDMLSGTRSSRVPCETLSLPQSCRILLIQSHAGSSSDLASDFTSVRGIEAPPMFGVPTPECSTFELGKGHLVRYPPEQGTAYHIVKQRPLCAAPFSRCPRFSQDQYLSVASSVPMYGHINT